MKKTIILALIAMGLLALVLSGCSKNSYQRLPSYHMSGLYNEYITKQHKCYSFDLDKEVIVSGDIKGFAWDDARVIDYNNKGDIILFGNVRFLSGNDLITCWTPKDNYFDEKAMDRFTYKNNL